MKYNVVDVMFALGAVAVVVAFLALLIAEATTDRTYEFEQIRVVDKWSRAKNTPAIRTSSGDKYTIANLARIEEDNCYQIAIELGSAIDSHYDGKVVAYKQIDCGDVK